MMCSVWTRERSEMRLDFSLSEETYYSPEANREYMSVSQYKDFAGTYGKAACEAASLARLWGKWAEEPSTAMLVGSYVDHYFEGTLDGFRAEHPEIFRKDGGLKAEYVQAEKLIERAERDPLFCKYLSGEKQKIMTGEYGGCKWKIKMDSYHEGKAIVDLKVVASIREAKWTKETGYLDFVRYWGYDIQGAVYQEIVRQNTGKKLPFYIAALSKEKEPDIEIIQVSDIYLQDALARVEAHLPRVLAVKDGREPPKRCGRCEYCKRTKVLRKPIGIGELMIDG